MTDQAKALADKIEKKARDLIAPLETEMRIMGWRPEFQEIMWTAVAQEAMARAAATKS